MLLDLVRVPAGVILGFSGVYVYQFLVSLAVVLFVMFMTCFLRVTGWKPGVTGCFKTFFRREDLGARDFNLKG